MVANAVKKGFVYGGKRFAYNAASGKVLVANAKKSTKNMDEEVVECEEGDEECMADNAGSDGLRGENIEGQTRAMWAKDPENPYAENQRAANKKHAPITERLSPEELQVWNNVVRADKRERQRLTSQLQKIAETTGDPRKKSLIANKLKGNLPVGDLEELLVLVSPVANSRREEPADDNGPLYFGNNPAYGLTENEQSQVLDIEEARKSYDPVLTKRRRQYADA